MLRAPNGSVAELYSRPAAPSRTMGRRGPLAPCPRPAQQLWGMYVPSMLAVLPFVPELSVLLMRVGCGETVDGKRNSRR